MDKGLARSLCVSTVMLIGTMGAAYAGTHSPELKRLPSNRMVDVIITFDESRPANVGLGYKLRNLPNGELRRMTVADAVRASALVNVAHVSVNHAVMATATPGYDFMPQQIQPVTLPLFGYQQATQGNNIGVVVIDSGITPNADLPSGSVIAYAESFVPTEDTNDYFGHGTHVAGLIAGQGVNSLYGYTNDIFGVSPGVNLINLKVLDQNGNSDDATVISAIERAIALKTNPDTNRNLNIRVINLSLGRPIYESFLTDPLCKEVEKAWLQGITVVVAAGNDGRVSASTKNTAGYGTIASPGNDPLVLTVGAINTESSPDRSKVLMTTYSSKGPSLGDNVTKPDIVAPGNKLYSVKAQGSYLAANTPYGDTGSYLVLSGTSMATAVTSGSVAAVLAANPALTNDQVKARLMKTATKLQNSTPYLVDQHPLQNDIFTVGAGYLNLDAAL